MSSSTASASSGSGSVSAWFSKFASSTARAVGHPAAFTIAVVSVLVWAVSGPFFGFSDTWQLIINTTTTILTNLIVFLIQNTQNRDTAALQLKIDELIRATENAHNAVLDFEELSESDLARIRARYEGLAQKARKDRMGILADDDLELEAERVGEAGQVAEEAGETAEEAGREAGREAEEAARARRS